MIRTSSHISAIMAFFNHPSLLSIWIIFCFLCLDCGSSTDTITSSGYIKGQETLSSNNSRFTLGFFSPENSTNRFVGIWYMSKSTIIWVANRNQPLKDTSGSFKIAEDGNLVVLNGTEHVIWSSKIPNIATNSSGQLQDSGNLVLVDNRGNKVWESFKHPTDTWLPNMKLTNNRRTGEKVEFTSWKSPSDPSIGNFTLGFGNLSITEGFIWNKTTPFWRTGPWNGKVFVGIPLMNSSYLNGYDAGNEDDGTSYVTFSYANDSLLAMYVLTWQGKLQRKDWVDEKKQWQVGWNAPTSECDVYGVCGAFGICGSQSSPICSCLKGFEPRNREEWNTQNWTGGCVRRTTLQCESAKSVNGSVNRQEDDFLKLQLVKVPDHAEWSWVKTQDTCRSQCLNNCTCIAYSYDDGIGCMTWSVNLIDIQQFSNGGIDLYIRLAKSDLEVNVNDKKKDATTVIITVTVIVGGIIILTSAYFLCKHLAMLNEAIRKRKRERFSVFKSGEAPTANKSEIGELSNVELQEMLLIDAEKLAVATNNFHLSNKLGQGGFGPVYKFKITLESKLAHILGLAIVVINCFAFYGSGYMAPEYAMEGFFSEKSDVFSFGVLLLEIVSGRRNSSFYNDEHSLSLLGFAWKLWNEENIVSLIDPSIYDPICEKEIWRCVHIALLCTQESARDRPTMDTVISMLKSEIVNLLPPGKPAFILRQNMLNSSHSEDCHALLSDNSMSVTQIQGR
ncbi:hypothetical protein VNO77_22089 [Canavalia gladiata]|uniref:Receptor-like serine/threonine-protein kinase n=1 Tax=Canavalia gladiata TaxID=3824 RepID=A0AAN9Q7Q2_CANGL